MKEPNFSVVGAPKCGTSARHHDISDHPQVFLPKNKEPHYYCTDTPGYPRLTSAKQYRQLFDDAGEHRVAVNEGSVFYLHSRAVVPNILREHPDAKFVVMVRDPVEMAHSLHSRDLAPRPLRDGSPGRPTSLDSHGSQRSESTVPKAVPSTRRAGEHFNTSGPRRECRDPRGMSGRCR